MSKFRLLKYLLSIWVLGLIHATLISHALSQEKTFQLPVFIPTLQQKFAISMYNYSRKINDDPKKPLMMGLKSQIASCVS